MVLSATFAAFVSSGHDCSRRESVDDRGKASMTSESEAGVIRAFQEHVRNGDLSQVRVVWRVGGGMPAERRIDEVLNVTGDGAARLHALEGARETIVSSRQLDASQTSELFRQVSSGVGDLVPPSQARFLPDSVVGSVTIDVAGQRATLYFPVEETNQGLTEGIATVGLNPAAIPPARLASPLRRRFGA
jgi:hypothetical protein